MCADCVGWNWENEGYVRPLEEKEHALLKADYIYFPCCYYFFLKKIYIFSLYFVVQVFCLC